jgi:phosphatidate cytidylyltransferase
MARGSTGVVRSLGTRLLTATAGLAVLLVVVWAGSPWAAVFAGSVILFGIHEFYRLSTTAGGRPLWILGNAWAVGIVVVVVFDDGLIALSVLGGGGLVVAAAAMVSSGFPGGMYRWFTTTAGALYVALPLAAALLLRDGAQGLEWLLLALLATFATDTTAFATGRAIGRARMAPRISPGKTWEGALGGLLGGSGATAGLVVLLELPLALGWAVLLGAVVSVAAQVGDLAESSLKRRAGAKESGVLFPGHGGMLDRLDSLVLVLPLVYYVARVWPAP